MNDLENRTAVVIGGGSGVGRGIALALAAESMQVVVADIDEDAARRVGEEITRRGGDAHATSVDATERDSLGRLADVAVAEFGPVHLLSNNVGVSRRTPLDQATESDWAWQIEFNVMSIVRAVDVFLPVLRSHGEEAHIVNTASIAGLLAAEPPTGPALGLYVATKHAVVGYSLTLRRELEHEGLIGVSVLCPGGVESNLDATSARNRPERYGGSFEPAVPRAAHSGHGRIEGEDLGRVVVRGVRANRAYVFTHPELRMPMEEAQRLVIDDFRFFDT